MQIKDLMTKDVSSVKRNSTLQDAAKIMKDLNVGAIPVCDGKQAVGIITDRDIAIRNVANAGMANTPVEQVMSTNLISGHPQMSDQEAARLMAENQIRRLPIMENKEIVGIVSLGDLAVQSASDMEAGEALSSISYPSKPAK